MDKSEQINELAAALAKAQGEFSPVEKTGDNPHLKSSYVTLDGIIAAIRQPLANNGLSFVQSLGNSADGAATLTTALMHESGQWLTSTSAILANPGNRGVNEIQAFGAAITYMRRYALAALLGIASDSDDDGNGAKSGASPRKRQKTGKAPSRDDSVSVNEYSVQWALGKTTAKGTPFIELDDGQLRTVAAKAKDPGLVKAAKILLDPAAKPIRDALNSQPADEPASEQPAEEPKPAAKRPYQPAELRVMLHTKARGRGADLPASEKQAPFVARKFAEALADQDDPTTAYHKALNWLFGTTSAKELNLAQAKAILDWLLDPSGSDDTGDTPLHPAASAEALLILQQARKGAGQTAGDDIPY